ncbi:hypothetical protein BDV96DRAFT_654762 [Lophiotrema nucula]|uniref:Uncharacterized protein n=1 Tax=Lophiotrema nucula TaxID=690887 RepID=A0A6A5YH57_9PLEO|nr:hypothetical protein BDV96DRAFT_654762 [Lophiotrema nucula]
MSVTSSPNRHNTVTPQQDSDWDNLSSTSSETLCSSMPSLVSDEDSCTSLPPLIPIEGESVDCESTDGASASVEAQHDPVSVPVPSQTNEEMEMEMPELVDAQQEEDNLVVDGAEYEVLTQQIKAARDWLGKKNSELKAAEKHLEKKDAEVSELKKHLEVRKRFLVERQVALAACEMELEAEQALVVKLGAEKSEVLKALIAARETNEGLVCKLQSTKPYAQMQQAEVAQLQHQLTESQLAQTALQREAKARKHLAAEQGCLIRDQQACLRTANKKLKAAALECRDTGLSCKHWAERAKTLDAELAQTKAQVLAKGREVEALKDAQASCVSELEQLLVGASKECEDVTARSAVQEKTITSDQDNLHSAQADTLKFELALDSERKRWRNVFDTNMQHKDTKIADLETSNQELKTHLEAAAKREKQHLESIRKMQEKAWIETAVAANNRWRIPCKCKDDAKGWVKPKESYVRTLPSQWASPGDAGKPSKWSEAYHELARKHAEERGKLVLQEREQLRKCCDELKGALEEVKDTVTEKNDVVLEKRDAVMEKHNETMEKLRKKDEQKRLEKEKNGKGRFHVGDFVIQVILLGLILFLTLTGKVCVER